MQQNTVRETIQEDTVQDPVRPPGRGALQGPVPFDRQLIRKYDRPGPRYTSYPAAPHFRDDFGAADYRRLLTASAATDRPLSLYVHVPFCSKRCFFCGCHVKIARDHDRGKAYLPRLEAEMARVASLAGAAERDVVQVHWGGGTPTFLPPEDLRKLAAMLRRHFRLAEDCEIGVEIDPRECTSEHLDALQEGGFNRLSVGVQDLDPKVQRAVNRIQPLEMTREVVDGARRRGMESVNVDLIYGLPHQTADGFAETLKQVSRQLSPDRLAVFNFAYLPNMLPHQKVLDPEAIPGPEDKLTLLETAVHGLTDLGYVFIGMDHFARPDDSLARALAEGTMTRNFQGYSTCGETDLLAFGVSAIGQVAGGYAQNEKEIPRYGERIEDDGLATVRGLALTDEDELRRDVIMTLMCNFGLDKAAAARRHDLGDGSAAAFDRHFADELAGLDPLVEDELLEIHPDRLEVTPRGRLLVRNIAMAFDEHLPKETRVRYSRTV